MDIFSNIKEVFTETLSLFPDSILFTSIFLYLLTQNTSYGVLSIFIIELIGSHKFISWLMYNTFGIENTRRNITSSTIKQCEYGFKTIDVRGKIPINRMYPSYGVFSMISVFTYLTASIIEFSKTLISMGNDWSYRVYVSYFFILCLTALFIIYNFINGCGTSQELMIAVGFGIICGFIFYYINLKIFGIEGMNFLGLPYAISKESNNSPIYICVDQQ